MIMKLSVESRESRGRRPEAKRRTDGRLPVRWIGISFQFSVFSFLVLAGCATVPKPVPLPPPNVISQAAPPPAAPMVANPPVPVHKPSPAPPGKVLPPASTTTSAPEKDEFVLSIDSEPAGAIIVVNDIPIGKAPQRLKVKMTLQGFFRDYMTIKARFVATSLAETSHTVEEDCTPLEKIPGKIIFTPHGTQRQSQDVSLK